MGFIQYALEDPAFYAAAVMTIILSITLHELAHGWVAGRLGDDTPYWSGHMTWNPLVHMGPFSLLACFLAGIAWGQMPVDPSRLRGKYAETYVAVAGPVTNLILAFLALTGLGLWMRMGLDPGNFRVQNALMVLTVFGTFNLLLFVFNLIPVPPLDGSRIVANFHRGYERWAYDPQNQGIRLMLFIGAFIVARPLARELGNAGMWYAAVIAGA